jgi:16S rRNA (uracil1498-N3)-methyltransferase
VTPPVFLVLTSALAEARADSIVRISGPEGRHAATVRRLAPGEAVTLVDGEGRWAAGTVASVPDRETVDVTIGDVTLDAEPSPRVVVVQALAKGDRGERAVELLTEVGVDAIVPWSAARCVAAWRGDRAERGHRRWVDAAMAAAKQSRRTRFPLVEPLTTTADVLDRVRAAQYAIVLDETAGSYLAHHPLPDAGEALVIVGPEGGLTDEERAAFVAAGAVPVRLGPSVLRTSSAGMAAVAALLATTPRWAPTASDGMGG